MATSNILANSSRRRTEALKFLSCISLDGTYCKPVQNFHRKQMIQCDLSSNSTKKCGKLKEDVDVPIADFGTSEHISKKYKDIPNKYDDDHHSNSSDSDFIGVPNNQVFEEPILVKSIAFQSTTSKKRASTCSRESTTKTKIVTGSRKKKLQHSSTCSDSEHHYDSSCESICPLVTNRLKTKGLVCKAITESNSDLNIKFVKSVKDHKFHGERIIMVTKKRIPFLVCSFIPYGSTERSRSDFHKEVLRKRHATRTRPMSSISDACNQFELFGIIKCEDGQEVSYGKLLVPTRLLKDYLDKKHSSDSSTDLLNQPMGHNRHLLARCYSYDQSGQRGMMHLATSPPIPNSKENIFISSMLLYNPTLLDDPELIAGKHRTLLTFSSYVTSIIDYVRPCDLKKELNDKFKEKFPHIKLTLSKLRSIKKDMCKIAKSESGTELLTVAQAYVYFEKLILRGLINKQNRKLCAAASLLLSAKLNDFKGDTLKLLIERIENVFRLNRRELFESEFAVLVALEFGLHIPASEVYPHYQRLLYES